MQRPGEIEANRRVTEHLVQNALGGVDIVDMSERRAWRGVNTETPALAQQRNPKKMRAVRDDNNGVEVVCRGDLSKLRHLLLRVEGVGFGDDLVERNPIRQQVVAAHAAFGAAGVFVGATAKGNDDGRDAVLVEGNGFVE